MELYYEPSVSAYILLQEVMNELRVKKPIEEIRKNCNVKKILRKCNKIIDERYPDEDYREKLKFFIANTFSNDFNVYFDDLSVQNVN